MARAAARAILFRAHSNAFRDHPRDNDEPISIVGHC